MRRALLVAVLAALMVMASAGAALAGEWNKGHFNEPGGNIPAKDVAQSECLFNGQDEPDDPITGEPPFDDGLWSSTPAGANNAAGIRVQSGGQIVAAFGPEGNAGAQGVACNPNTNPRPWG